VCQISLPSLSNPSYSNDECIFQAIKEDIQGVFGVYVSPA